jgi:NAD(P)-dependent dehydrogenase (short-subunit alcohol dehydrogenase family)
MTAFFLEGRTAIISGASRGIGEAIAWAFADAGANVVVSSRKPENIDPVAEAINRKYPDRVLALAVHAGKQESARMLVEAATNKYGRLDITVNNAATNPHFGPILTATESQWDKILEVNVKGYYWLSQASAAQMRKQGGGGKIINVASVAGLEPSLMLGVYSVSKAAVIMFTKVLALELGADNIQVNAIAPGFVKTRFSQALWSNDALNQSILDRTPAGRMAEPDEVVGAALYLASKASDFTTGEIIKIDGGYTLT